jgi:nitroreductase
MANEIGLFEAIHSLRAMRRLTTDPVPEPLIWRILEAGTMAPSGGNSQPWRFLVVQDADGKRFIQERYQRAWNGYLAANQALAQRRAEPPPLEEAAARMRLALAASHLAAHMHEAPVLIVVCLMPREPLPPIDGKAVQWPTAGLYASIFPAVQNMLLAARGLGLGATLTTLHLVFEPEIKERFGIPAEVETVALLPIGWPSGRFGPITRAPVQDVTFWDGWNQPRARPA